MREGSATEPSPLQRGPALHARLAASSQYGTMKYLFSPMGSAQLFKGAPPLNKSKSRTCPSAPTAMHMPSPSCTARPDPWSDPTCPVVRHMA